MRWYAMGLIALSLAACGSQYKAKRPVLDNWERVSGFGDAEVSRARYSGPPVVAAPVPPIMAFGAQFDLGLHVRSKGASFADHRIGRIDGPDGPLWVALEARASDGEQVLLAGVPDIDTLMPELPLERISTALVVDDRSTAEQVEVTVEYENADGRPVRLVVESDTPWKRARKRSAPTTGISEATLLALVDVTAQQSAFKADLDIGGRDTRLRKAGLVPHQYVGTQAIGGLTAGSFHVKQGREFSFDSTMAAMTVHAKDAPPPEPAPVVEPEEEPDPLQVALAGHREVLQGCYSARAEANPALAGQVLLSFNVTDGTGTDFTVISNTTEDEDLAGCLTERLGEWSFPEGVQGDLGFPFTFVAGKGLLLGGERRAEGSDRTLVRDRPDTEADEALPEGDSVASLDEELPDDALLDDPLEDEGRLKRPAWGPTLAHFSTMHTMPSGNTVEMPWEVSRKGQRVFAMQHSEHRTLTYEYLVRHDALELVRIAVTQFGNAVPATEVTFSPALPDLRRPFDGRQRSRFVVDVNGQQGYAVGTAEAWWTESGTKLEVVPEAPDWAAGRKMVSTMTFGEGEAAVRVQRTE